MNNFLITYASGLKSEIRSDLESVEAFCNQHFGSTWGEASANGAAVEMTAVPTEPTTPSEPDPAANPLPQATPHGEAPGSTLAPADPVTAGAGTLTATVTQP